MKKTKKVFLGGVYTEDSKRFNAGLLPNMSRCIKAVRHDAGVVIAEVEDANNEESGSGGYIPK